ncbi:WW domain-containing adapter protein with coiled-coil-like [Haliotis rubra]|uniref:WW domain-containing adapter protein with coiled-coil-like n=1 Tax=Haliotis rubra TaxID=36100 RepID=UPI001EE5BE0B|nr:WW domain-containing adapter protein with coiled-coil-like [Haliotis rubra]
MVMHARKQPRLNDGFADRKDTHLHQNMQYQSKGLGGLFNDRYERGGRDSHDDRAREDVPGSHPSPRYQNKSSYIERNKEKRGGSSGQWEKSNHQMSSSTSTSSSRGGGGGGMDNPTVEQGAAVKTITTDPSRMSQRIRRTPRTERRFRSRQYECLETGLNTSVHPRSDTTTTVELKSLSGKSQRNGLIALEPQTTADQRMDGFLASHIHPPLQPPQVEPMTGAKHSSSGERERPDKYPRSNSDSSVKHSEKFSPTDRPKIVYSKDVSNTASLRTSNLLQRANSTSDSSAYKEGYTDHRKNNYPYSSVDPMRRRQRHESESSRSSIGHTTPQKNDDSNHADDMEISPGSTPTSSRGVKASSCTAALQTLQKLQEALNMHIARTQQNWAQNNLPQQHSSPQQHPQQQHSHQPQKHNQGNQQHPQHSATSSSSHYPNPENGGGGGHDSPISDVSPCHSPTTSTTSSQNLPVATSALSGASIKKDNSVELTPSLSNYYNEKLIGHVLGWQADHAERQANRYMEEALNVGSLHCSQVSVELKKARSLVRVAEIQSTLHEQRILFLDKQISEIDNLKPGTTFLPS